MRADTYLESKSFNKALHIYKFLRIYCRIAGRVEEEMNIAEQIGQMYKYSNNHAKAAEMFRLVLKYSWICNDINMELKTYDNLSNEHFHMGNIGKSKYYSERFDRGLIESDLSRMKSSVVQPYKDTKKEK